MRIGLIDVDGHNFPNFALLKIAGYWRDKGVKCEMVDGMFSDHYDIVYKSKVFTFTPDYQYPIDADKVISGGTGYDIHSRLPQEIEDSTSMDYSIYADKFPFSVQFLSRGCIRHCPFCLVHDKEGYIHYVSPAELNPQGKWIEVLDNNFFANPKWRDAVEYLKSTKQPINLHGVDVRIMDKEQAKALSEMRMKQAIHIAWDLPADSIGDKIAKMAELVNPNKIVCYVLVGFNTTIGQDLYRLRKLKELGVVPFVQPYRDYDNSRTPSNYEKDLARWANRRELFKSIDFSDYEPRKGFCCNRYL